MTKDRGIIYLLVAFGTTTGCITIPKLLPLNNATPTTAFAYLDPTAFTQTATRPMLHLVFVVRQDVHQAQACIVTHRRISARLDHHVQPSMALLLMLGHADVEMLGAQMLLA